jgi:thiol-disulfide isomerase/thioredoxin
VRRALPIVVLVAVAAVVVIGLSQAGGGTGSAPEQRFSLQRALQRLEGAPKPLAALHGQASDLLTGGPKDFRARLKALRGHPVVVNKWASWCGPCRHEFPIFQQVSAERGRTVAFVGLDAGDGTKPAREFLGDYPVPYPSYEDPDEAIARDIGAPANYPITVFYDERGEQAFIRQGGYRSVAQLEGDIDRYLG